MGDIKPLGEHPRWEDLYEIIYALGRALEDSSVEGSRECAYQAGRIQALLGMMREDALRRQRGEAGE